MPQLYFGAQRVIISLEARPKTQAELVEALDIQPSVVREHLDALIAADLVHVMARVRSGSGLIETYAAGSKVRPSGRRRRRKSVERLEMPAR